MQTFTRWGESAAGLAGIIVGGAGPAVSGWETGGGDEGGAPVSTGTGGGESGGRPGSDATGLGRGERIGVIDVSGGVVGAGALGSSGRPGRTSPGLTPSRSEPRSMAARTASTRGPRPRRPFLSRLPGSG